MEKYTVISSKYFKIGTENFIINQGLIKVAIVIPNEIKNKENLFVGIKKSGDLSYQKLNSQIFGNKIIAENISLSITGTTEFVLLGSRQLLSFETLELVPNPFSSYKSGLQIKYKLNCEKGKPRITIKIYNMLGELVKSLIENKYCGVFEEYIEIWNGTDDFNKSCCNGRYLVLLQITDGTFVKKTIKQVVLWK
ncbi:MAG: hypothetical protein ABIB46_02375 [bacterium]